MATNRYPLKLRKVEGSSVISKRVNSAEEEAEHIAAGWSPKFPELPNPEHNATGVPPESLGPVFSSLAALTARIEELEQRVEKLESKRGPGRPPKE